MPKRAPEIAVIGGGTGSFTLLQELKTLTPEITAIPAMSDNGGGTGALVSEFGVLPPGDIRQCLVALSNLPRIRQIFNKRIPEGRWAGQAVGNGIISLLEMGEQGDIREAISYAGEILQITGRVEPVTVQKHELVLRDSDVIIRGEEQIEKTTIKNKFPLVYHEPRTTLNEAAYDVITSADLVVLAPGSRITSLEAALTVQGMARAFEDTKAKVVQVANLMNKTGHTDDWHVVDYVSAYEQYIGDGRIDYVLFNNKPLPPHLLKIYAAESERPVHFRASRFKEIAAQAIGDAFAATEIYKPCPHDALGSSRSLVRHDARLVGEHLMSLL